MGCDGVLRRGADSGVEEADEADAKVAPSDIPDYRWSASVRRIWGRTVRAVVNQLSSEYGAESGRDELARWLNSHRDELMAKVLPAAEPVERGARRLGRFWQFLVPLCVLLIISGVVLAAVFGVPRSCPAGHTQGRCHVDAWSIVGTNAVALGVFLLLFPISVAVGDRLPGPVRRRLRLDDPAENHLRWVLGDVLSEELRDHLNETLPSSPMEVPQLHSSGLSELADASLQVSTTNRAALLAALQTMRGGSLGVAGPRGVGKSVLLKAVTNGYFKPDERRTIGTAVAAPVRYEAADFVALIFSSLCLAVLEGKDPDRRDRWRLRSAVRALVLVLIAAALWVGADAVAGAPFSISAATIRTGAFIVMLLGAAIAFAAATIAAIQAADEDRAVARAARSNLHELRNLDTVTRRGGVQLVPSGLFNLTGEGERSSTRQAATLAELVRRYKAFVELLTSHKRVVIVGIDELDKLAGEGAQQFVNDIKTVFGQRDTYYVVSVSEDAMSDFERRGTPFRTAFDSAFDAVMPIRPLNAQESRRLLNRRVIGMGVAPQMIAYAYSGGMPRDLIRVARDIVAFADGGSVTVQDIVWPLAVKRMRAAEDAVESVARRHVWADGTQPLLAWLRRQPDLDDRAEEALASRCCKVEPVLNAAAGVPEIMGVALQLAMVAYHTLTVAQFFETVEEDDFQALGRREEAPQPDILFERIGLLARGRLDMTLAPALAWATVSRLRVEAELRVPATEVPFPTAPDWRASGVSAAGNGGPSI